MSDVAPFVKICVLGASGAGKTALLERLAGGDFPQEASCTTKPFSKPASIANMHQENAASLTSPKLLQVKFVECPSSFSDDKSLASVMAEAFCTLLVYDVTDRASFDEAMRRWYPVANGLSPESFKMIVGCKVDAISERVVEPSPDTMPDLFFVEVSAKDRTNVDLVKSILFLRAKHMIEKRNSILEEHAYESPSNLDDAFQNMYGAELKPTPADAADLLKEGLRHAAADGANGTTIQDLLDSMPFALGRPTGVGPAGAQPAVDDAAASTAASHATAPGWGSSPLGEAIDALVDRLEMAKSRGGHLSSAGATPQPANGADGERQVPVDKLARKYSELKKAFALCGITIDPPFPADLDLELADLDLETLSRTPLRADQGAPITPPPASSSREEPRRSSKPVAPPAASPTARPPAAAPSQPKPLTLRTTNLATAKPTRDASPYSSRSHDWRPASRNSKDVLTIKIELSGGREGTIHVKQGDSPFQLAADFVAREGLSGGEKTTQRLAKLISTKVENVVSTINAAPPSASPTPKVSARTHSSGSRDSASKHEVASARAARARAPPPPGNRSPAPALGRRGSRSQRSRWTLRRAKPARLS